MPFKEIPGGQNMLVHEDGRVRIGLRNLPRNSDLLTHPVNEEGEKLNEWPVLVIRGGHGERETMLLPEAVLKTHAGVEPAAVIEPADIKSKSGSKSEIKDSALSNIIYNPAGDKGHRVKKGGVYVDKPEKRKEAETKDEAPDPQEPSKSNEQPDELPDSNKDAAAVEEGYNKLQEGSGALTAKEAIEVIEKYDFEELRDMGFYTEDQRERGPRTTVKEAWEKVVEEYKATTN